MSCSMKHTRTMAVWIVIAGIAVLLSGCSEAGLFTGQDSGDTGAGSSDPDISGQMLHLGFDGDLTDETGTVGAVDVLDGSGSAGAASYGADRSDNAGGALELDGSYFLRITDLDLSSLGSLTITAWIRDDGSQTEKDRRIVAYTSGPAYDEFTARIRKFGSESWQDNSFEAFLENSGGNGTRTAEPVTPGSWVHVAMVYDADTGELVLYQDGERKNTRALDLDLANGNLIIGGGKNNEEFHGRIDDLVVFNRALSDQDVAHARTAIGGNP